MALVRAIVAYTCETWALSVGVINIMWTSECKEGWRIRNNNELRNLIKVGDIVKYTKEQRIKCWGQLNSMEDIKLVIRDD